MNFRDLKYLLAVADQRHFGKAAELSHVSQPTLSAQLKKMEEELGVQLFERNNKHVMITPIGELIVQQARVAVYEMEQLKELAQQVKDPLSGRFRLGVIPTLAPYLLPHVIPTLRKQLPKLELHLHEDKTHIIHKKLKEGELDAIVLALPVMTEGFVTYPLFLEDFYLAVPLDHRFASKAKIKLDQLQNETLLLLDDGHCLREQALDVCSLGGIKEKPGFRASSLETLRHMVAAGGGMTLLPATALSKETQKDPLLHCIPFAKPAPGRTIIMMWRKTRVRQECCELIARVMSELKLPGVTKCKLG